MMGRRIFLGVAIAALLAFSAVPVLANVAQSLTIIHDVDEEDSFWNYDFRSESVASNNVDWATDMIFWDNAVVDKVKHMYFWPPAPGESKNFRLYDGENGWEWDSDCGTKEVTPGHSPGWVLHMRVYAPPGGEHPDQFYDDTWGYYVIGTCHFDQFPEVPGTSIHGYSETAEGWFCYIAWEDGYTVNEDCYDMHNQQNGWDEKYPETSYWENNGNGSKVRVP